MFSIYPSPQEALMDDTTQIQRALDRGADEILFAPGTYKISQPLTIKNSPVKLKGVRGLTVLQFTGPTDGLVFADVMLRHVVVEGLSIQTTNATAGKAINLSCPNTGAANIVLRDVDIASSGAGVWAYGIYADNWQTSSVYSLRIESSAAIGAHFQNSSNAVSFYGCEIAGAAFANRAIELAATGSGSEVYFNGGTMQGNFVQSVANVAGGSQLALFNCHIENTNGSPSDGADLVNAASSLWLVNGGSGSLQTSGASVTYAIGAGIGTVSLGASSSASFFFGCNIVSFSDAANNATVLGSRFTSGSQITNRVQGNTAASATAGANGAVPSQVAGYLIWNIGGTNYKIPYFNT